jgi:hypothetical protein
MKSIYKFAWYMFGVLTGTAGAAYSYSSPDAEYLEWWILIFILIMFLLLSQAERWLASD